MPGLVWRCVADGRCVFVNARWPRFTGAPPSALLGEGWLEFLHPDDREAVRQSWAAAVRDGRDGRFVGRLRRHDGAYRWFETTTAVATDDDGRPESWALVSLDREDERARVEANGAGPERLERLVSAIPMVLCTFEQQPDGRTAFPYANSQMEQLFGVPAGVLRANGDPVFAQTHPDDLDRLRGSIAESARALSVWHDEFRILRDGVERWVEGWSVPEALPSGGVRWQGFVADVTDRKRAAIDARVWTSTFEQAGLGITRVDAATNTFLAVNPAYAAMRGLTPADVIGQPITDAYAPERRPTIQGLVRDADARGHLTFESEQLRADGSTVPVLVDVTVVYDDRGAPSSRVVFFKDITERRRAQARASLWQRAFEQADVAIALGDTSGRLAAVNPTFARQRGYDVEELVGQPVTMTVAEHFQPRIHRILGGNVDHHVLESLHRRKDGSTFPVMADITSVRDEHDHVVARVGFFQDLTAQREAERVRQQSEDALQQLNAELEQRVERRTAQLAAANQELEAFSYSVSHDLRAPLRGIAGWSQALIEDCGDALDETGRQHLARVQSETRRMDALIDDLLRFSRVGRVELTRAPTDVSALVGQVADRLRAIHRDRRFEVRIAGGLTADADARLLDVVFTNLLENAVKFTGTRAEAQIEIGASPGVRDGETGFFIRDNGVGFDMVYADALFGPFKRLHRASEFPGTGIGLATVQRIVHRHGGRVWAEARVNDGATFHFTIGPAS